MGWCREERFADELDPESEQNRVIYVRVISKRDGDRGGKSVGVTDVWYEGPNAAAGAVRDAIKKLLAGDVDSIELAIGDPAVGWPDPPYEQLDRVSLAGVAIDEYHQKRLAMADSRVTGSKEELHAAAKEHVLRGIRERQEPPA